MLRTMRLWPLVTLLMVLGCGGDESGEQPSGLASTAPAESQGGLGDATYAEEGQPEEVLAGPAPIVGTSTTGKGLPRCTDDRVTVTAETRARAEKATVCLANKVRRRRGRPALRHSDQLYKAARKHAADMAEANYFSHVSRSGATVTSRVKATGYLKTGGWQVGENIAWGGGTLSTPAAIVQAWLNSAGHRQNLLRASYRDAGLAIVAGAPVSGIGGAAGTYVHNFGRRR